MTHFLTKVCTIWFFLSCSPSYGADGPTVSVELEREGDTVVVTQEQDRTVVAVTCKSGIGRAKLSGKDNVWPQAVTLRLCYASGKAFTTLEGFELSSSRLQVRCNSGQSRKAPFFLLVDEGKYSRDDLNPSGWLNLEFKPHGDDVDVVFPAGLFRGEKEVRVQWIDYYRN